MAVILDPLPAPSENLEGFFTPCDAKFESEWWHTLSHSDKRRCADVPPLKEMPIRRHLLWIKSVIRKPDDRFTRHIIIEILNTDTALWGKKHGSKLLELNVFHVRRESVLTVVGTL